MQMASQGLKDEMVRRGSLAWQVCLELMGDQEQKALRVFLECPEEQASREIEGFLGLQVLMDDLVELVLLG